MDDRLIRKQLRGQMNINGWVMLLYYALMNVMVTAMFVSQILAYAMNGVELTEEQMNGLLLSNGWGYVIASITGFVLLLLWKKKQFCFHEIWKSDKRMTFGSFLVLLCLFLGGQGLFQLYSWGLEFLLNQIGLSGMAAIESASITADTVSMFLYICIIAPIAEEILFRGLLLRMLMPYGKRLAILATAFLFGMFHGNPMQSPYAFVVGLVLGYVAAEYSIRWAMALHFINNLVLGDLFTRLVKLIPLWLGDLLFMVIIWGSLLAALILLICYRKRIAAYIRQNPMHPWCINAFFTSPGILIFCGLMIFSMVMSITAL